MSERGYQSHDWFIATGSTTVERITTDHSITWYEGWDVDSAYTDNVFPMSSSGVRWTTEGQFFQYGLAGGADQEAIVATKCVKVEDQVCTMRMLREQAGPHGSSHLRYNGGTWSAPTTTTQYSEWKTCHMHMNVADIIGPGMYIEFCQRWDIEDDAVAPSSWTSDFSGGASTGEIDCPDFFSYDPDGAPYHHNRWAVLQNDATNPDVLKVIDTTNATDAGWHRDRYEWVAATNVVTFYRSGSLRATLDGDDLNPDLPKNDHRIRLSMNVGGMYRSSVWPLDLDVPEDEYEYQVKYIKVGTL